MAGREGAFIYGHAVTVILVVGANLSKGRFLVEAELESMRTCSYRSSCKVPLQFTGRQ